MKWKNTDKNWRINMDKLPVIKGKQIVLRPIQLAHVSSTYLSWLHDEEVMQGIATTGYTLENLYKYVSEKIERPDICFYAIHAADDGSHIGNVKLDFFDEKANVSELGLLIGDKKYWGKGIGFEACKLLIDFGFKTLKLRKIYLAVYESNPAAKKLYEKLGFVLEGTLRKHVQVNGNYYDKYLMGLFANEAL